MIFSFPILVQAAIAAAMAGAVLGGCVAVAGGAMVGGAMVASDRRSVGAQVDDQSIELRAADAIGKLTGSRAHATATSYNRIVLLSGEVPTEAWWLLLANVFWAVAYDTEYAMVDREDDLRIGIKTSAITFGRFDVAAVMLCYAAALGIIGWVGGTLGMGWAFHGGLAIAAAIMAWHYTLIRSRDRMACFKAFLNNNLVGAAIFAGIALDFLISGRSIS